MSPGAILVLMALLFLGFGYMGVPVSFALMAGVFAATALTQVSLQSMVGQLFHGIDAETLLAVPFFLLVGELMTSANVVIRIANLSQALVGHIRGGLAQVVTVFSMFFADMSGSTSADVAVLSRTMAKPMEQEGYGRPFIAALIASASTIACRLAADTALVRCLMSISAIAITTLLVLKNQATSTDLSEKAQLLDLTHDAIFVRTLQNEIIFWNKAAEKLYGWQRDEVYGKSPHELLHTIFEKSAETEILEKGYWEGELIHQRRDGTSVVVSSRWALSAKDGKPAAILESNRDITLRKSEEDTTPCSVSPKFHSFAIPSPQS